MKRKILVADKDSSLKEAFRVIFSDDQYEILYASNGKEAEKLAEENRPEIYIVNVNLAKYNGIEVHKKLQKEKYLEGCRFFFLKDENDKTELLGFQAEGVIEKPINFFKVHERIHNEEDVIELTDVIEEQTESAKEPETVPHETGQVVAPEQNPAEPVVPTSPESPGFTDSKPADIERPELAATSPEPVVLVKGSPWEEPIMEQTTTTVETGKISEDRAFMEAANLETEVKAALGSVMQDAATKLIDAMAPAVSKYIENYTRRVLFEIAEKVIREEINKLLQESTDFPGKQI